MEVARSVEDPIVATLEPEEPAQAVVELLHGIAGTLMSIDARLERIAQLLEDENEGPDSDA